MAAPAIPRIRSGLIGIGLAVEERHRPASRGLADRYVVTASTDWSAERSGRLSDCGAIDPAQAGDRATLPAHDVDAVPTPDSHEVTRDALPAGKAVLREKPTGVDAKQAAAFPVPAAGHPDRTFLVSGKFFYRNDLRHIVTPSPDATTRTTVLRGVDDPVPGPVPLWRPRGSTGLFDGPPGQRVSSTASVAA